MVGTWRVSNECIQVLKKHWDEEEFIPIEDDTSVNGNIDILVFSSRCSENERRQVHRMYSVRCDVTTYIFNEMAVNSIEDETLGKNIVDLCVRECAWIDSLQIPVVKHCNLNCNRCYHFSNLVKNKELYELNDYKKDITTIKRLGFSIGEIRFLGGEPLLNDNLVEYITFTNSLFPNTILKVVTNGLLITRLSPQKCKMLSRMKVVFSISLYAPMHNKFDSIEKFLVSNNLRYEIFRIGNRFDKILLKNSNLEKVSIVVENCEKCVIVYKGQIGRCAPGMFITDFNLYFDACYPENNSLKLEEFNCTKDVLAYLDRAVPLCEWCTGDSHIESYPWSKTQNIKKEDYIIEN